MKNPRSSHRRALALCAAVGLLAALAGCNVMPPAQEDATRYFVLSDNTAAAQAQMAQGGLRIGLHPVALENYLDHKVMVMRTGANEVRFEDYRRWAEPLDVGVARILKSTLLSSPDVAQVFVEPFPVDQERDFDVTVKVVRCEGAAAPDGGHVASLEATFEVAAQGAAPHVVYRKVFAAPEEAWDGSDYGRLAALLSKEVGALGRAVLAGIPPKS